MDKKSNKKTNVKVDVWNITSAICDACLDGNYQDCNCDKTSHRSSMNNPCKQKEEHSSSDNLDKGYLTDSSDSRRKHLDSSGSFTDSITGEYISDNEFDDGFVSEQKVLPPSMTDWDTIDSILSDELDVSNDFDTTTRSSLSEKDNPNTRMVFMDSEESDKESVPDVEVYFDDNTDFSNSRLGSCSSDRNIESRDSGYVACVDFNDIEIEHVNDTKRRGSLEPAEEANILLTSLQLHEECEEKRRRDLEEKQQNQYSYYVELQKKSVEELRVLKESFELKVNEINMRLLQELSLRDELHSQNQALIMNADDISKASETVEEVPKTMPAKKARRRSFWFR